MKLSIIVPVYNEEKTIGKVLNKLLALKLPWPQEVIVIDDGSTDGTKMEIQKTIKTPRESVKIIYLKSNRGKGAAIRTGIKQATGDYILIHDADMEYDSDEIPKLLKALKTPLRQKLVAVYGSRFMYKNVAIPKAYYFGNKLLTWLTNVLYRTNLTDMETCYKLIPNNLQWNKLVCNGFDIEPEITIHLIKKRVPIIEVPIKYYSRSRKAGKKMTFNDAFSAIKVIIGKKF